MKRNGAPFLWNGCAVLAEYAGDIQAINKILKHYEGYIAKLSVRKMYDEYGCVHYCVDETLRRRLETKLIKTIIGFKIIR